MTKSGHRGSLAVEMVLLVPVLMTMVMFIVLVGKVQSASMALRHSTDVGARTGSVALIEDARHRAYVRTVDELNRSRHICASTHVHTQTKKINGEMMVVASAQCVIRVQGLSLLGVHGPTLKSTSVEVIDRYRSS
jgi:Flp pilus assembly protein TadG